MNQLPATIDISRPSLLLRPPPIDTTATIPTPKPLVEGRCQRCNAVADRCFFCNALACRCVSIFTGRPRQHYRSDGTPYDTKKVIPLF